MLNRFANTIQVEKGSSITSYEPYTAKGIKNTKCSNSFLFNQSKNLHNLDAKKWVVVGDSITEHNYRSTKNYHDYVAEEIGVTVVNMGLSGTGYMAGQDSGGGLAFYQRISSVPTDAEIVTIMGSINDFASVSEHLGDVTDTGTTTICGCINTTIDNLFEVVNSPRMGIIAPTPASGSDLSNPLSAHSLYCAKLEQICLNRNIPYLDLSHRSNLRPWVTRDNQLLFSCAESPAGDGTHPNANGHYLIKNAIKQFILSL